MVRLDREGEVFVLRMESGENRFTPDALPAWGSALDEVEKAGAPCGLVVTGSGKFFSNGLDLESMMSGGDPGGYLQSVLALLGRVLVLPMPTVAAVNGHAFGAGALLALCCDFRVMRLDRGYFCMPEIDLKAFLHPGMTAILRARLTPQTAHEIVTTGRRWGGEDARAAGIVEHAVDVDAVLPKALAIAGGLAGKADPVLARLKRDLYPEVLEALNRRLDL